MLHELRIYQAGGGRMAEMERLMATDCTAVLQRAKVPRPLGAWHAVAGPRLPAFVWILGWSSLEQRNAAWAAFGADAEWQQLRRTAHAKTELTARVDTQFMAAWPEPALAADSDLARPGGVYQLLLLRVHTGQGGAARQAFLAADRPAIEQAGGKVEAAFDLLSGDDLPLVAVVVRWADASACAAGMSTYDSSPSVYAARAAEREKMGFDLFIASDRYLMLSSPPFGVERVQQ
ncbi:MAG: NIPSNAP family protein [Burkholderiales bacterium]|nr:NIPSNAP family protein [Burkholderiales bacterium]